MSEMTYPPTSRPRPAFSIPSVLAVVSAVLSFKFGAILGLIFAIAAIVLGVIGVLLSLLPNIRGGIISFFSIVAGVFGIVAAVIKLIGHVV
jgi:hypothetical protein